MTVAIDVGVFGLGPRVTLRTSSVARSLWWGEPWQWATAAYWVSQAARCVVEQGRFRIGRTLREELAACVLGGFGMPATIGLAAFDAVRDAGLLEGDCAAVDIEAVLTRPMHLDGRLVRYRFPHQRAERLAAALRYVEPLPESADAVAVRDWLLDCPGVGYKTASWIVRNQYDSDEVAIIDVHLRRAGEAAGVFDRTWRVERHYRLYEQLFLLWAREGDVRPSVMDACIWSELAVLGSTSLPTRHP